MTRIEVINAIYDSILDLDNDELAGVYENVVVCSECRFVYKCHNYNRKCREFIKHNLENIEEVR